MGTVRRNSKKGRPSPSAATRPPGPRNGSYPSADGAGHDLHRTTGIVAPCPDDNLAHAAAPGREQCRMPAEEPLVRERLGEVAVLHQHHLDDALDVAVWRYHSSRSRPNRRAMKSAPGPRPALALDFAGLQEPHPAIKASRRASLWSENRRPSIRPRSLPCRCRTSANVGQDVLTPTEPGQSRIGGCGGSFYAPNVIDESYSTHGQRLSTLNKRRIACNSTQGMSKPSMLVRRAFAAVRRDCPSAASARRPSSNQGLAKLPDDEAR